ncbi:hypothetical protein BKA69DRAFT_1101014 [Paraphysoderma sedebokerense]|nr:hypothetical protein BKA69DRAFT_1101014 [Paraphysoderma sedebokerense]
MVPQCKVIHNRLKNREKFSGSIAIPPSSLQSLHPLASPLGYSYDLVSPVGVGMNMGVHNLTSPILGSPLASSFTPSQHPHAQLYQQQSQGHMPLPSPHQTTSYQNFATPQPSPSSQQAPNGNMNMPMNLQAQSLGDNQLNVGLGLSLSQSQSASSSSSSSPQIQNQSLPQQSHQQHQFQAPYPPQHSHTHPRQASLAQSTTHQSLASPLDVVFPSTVQNQQQSYLSNPSDHMQIQQTHHQTQSHGQYRNTALPVQIPCSPLTPVTPVTPMVSSAPSSSNASSSPYAAPSSSEGSVDQCAQNVMSSPTLENETQLDGDQNRVFADKKSFDNR